MPSSTPTYTALCLTNVENLPDAAEVTKFKILYAPNLQRAEGVIGSTVVDALLIQLPVAGNEAEELVSYLRMRLPDAPILVYQPTGAPNCAFEPASQGTCEYISVRVPTSELFERLSVGIRRNQAASESGREENDWSNGLVGSSSAMRQVIEVIGLVAPRRSTVMITGDTGSG